MCVPYLNYSSTSCYGLFKLAVFVSVRDVTDYFVFFFGHSFFKINSVAFCFWRLYVFPPKHLSSSFPVWKRNKSMYNRIVYQYRQQYLEFFFAVKFSLCTLSFISSTTNHNPATSVIRWKRKDSNSTSAL